MIAHRAVLVIIAGVFFLNSWATGSYSPSSFSVSGVALACADELEVIAQSEFWPFVKKHFKDRGLKLTEADYNDLEKWLKVVSGKNLAGEHQTKQNIRYILDDYIQNVLPVGGKASRGKSQSEYRREAKGGKHGGGSHKWRYGGYAFAFVFAASDLVHAESSDDVYRAMLTAGAGLLPWGTAIVITAEAADFVADAYVDRMEGQIREWNEEVAEAHRIAARTVASLSSEGIKVSAAPEQEVTVGISCTRSCFQVVAWTAFRAARNGRTITGPGGVKQLDPAALASLRQALISCIQGCKRTRPARTPTPTATPTATSTPTATPTITPTPVPYKCVCKGCIENKAAGWDIYDIDTPRDACGQFKFFDANNPTSQELIACQQLSCRYRTRAPLGTWDSSRCYPVRWAGPYCSSNLPQFWLFTTVTGGPGAIASSPSGIACGNDCKEPYPVNDTVVLEAIPLEGSAFVGWAGACSGTALKCSVKMTGVKNVQAKFDKRYILTIKTDGDGTGTVTSNPVGISCGGDCTEPYKPGTVVKLTAKAGAGATFTGWSGACKGTGTCSVTMSQVQQVTATFKVKPNYKMTVTKDGTGSGTVSSDVAGISCGGDCDESYMADTVVALKASPATGSAFTGWSGACAGKAACSIKMTDTKSVNATFDTLPKLPLTITKSGAGTGSVFSQPTGIDCGAQCQASFEQGTKVSVSASATGFSEFKGWKGAKECVGTGPCSVTMAEARTVEAVFGTRPKVTLTVATTGTGAGSVVIGNTKCGTRCSFDYAPGSRVLTTAQAASTSIFQGWTGACTGKGNCSLLLDKDSSVTARFDAAKTGTLTVKKGGAGSGTVTSNPSGILCGGDCSEPYAENKTIELSASPDSGSTFGGWSGACSGAGTCSITVTNTHSVTATFSRICTGEGSSASADCCVSLTRCKDGVCRANCTTPCVENGSNASGSCCNGKPRCDDGYCRASCPASCVPVGSNAAGSCCNGNPRCNDGYCKTSCSTPCVPAGSNAPGSCCDANPRCTDGYCKVSCAAPCVPVGSNAPGSCCDGNPRCDDGYCKVSCPAPCVSAGSNAPGICCPPAVRGTDGYCKRSGSTTR